VWGEQDDGLLFLSGGAGVKLKNGMLPVGKWFLKNMITDQKNLRAPDFKTALIPRMKGRKATI